jgi:hypothetical protein
VDGHGSTETAKDEIGLPFDVFLTIVSSPSCHRNR